MGAQYMLIDNTVGQATYPYSFPIGCATPNTEIKLCTDLASELISFLMYRTGRAFANSDSTTDVWSRMIWDLLEISKSKMSRRINSGHKSFHRQSTLDYDGMCFLATNSSNNISLFDDKRESLTNNELQASFHDIGAPSLIVIECFETEE
jgi:hypothetical protein